jgi:pimeloyl-ACP methyl ester carboxylesterase
VAGVTHHDVQAGDIRLHVAEAGAGEPLMLVHGTPQHWFCWRRVIPLLAPRYRVICPDLRGHGWSEARATGYDKEQFADDLLALLDALELASVKLVGHDWGGFASLLMCLRAPERVEAFLMLNMVHPWQQRLTPRQALEAWRFWYQLLLATPGLGPVLLRHTPFARFLLGLGWQQRDAWRDDEMREFVELLRRPERARGVCLTERAFLLDDLPRMMRGHWNGCRLTVPTRVLFSTKDFAQTPRMLEGHEGHADCFDTKLVDTSGHFLPDELPELVAAEAIDLFS